MTITAAPALYWPIDRTALCVGCGSVFLLAPRCPACASEAVLSLGKILNRERED